jgi:hypothetical protein
MVAAGAFGDRRHGSNVFVASDLAGASVGTAYSMTVNLMGASAGTAASVTTSTLGATLSLPR